MSKVQKIWEFHMDPLDMDLMDDLGLSRLGGYVFQWDSKTENPLVEVMIATNPRKALEIYAEYGWFGPDIELAMNKHDVKFKYFKDFFIYLESQGTIFNAKVIEQLFVKSDQTSPGYGRVNALNPFTVTQFLKSKFENVESRYNYYFKQSTSWQQL